MKKLIALSIVFGSAFLAVACDGDRSSTSAPTAAPSGEKAPAANQAVVPTAPALSGSAICQVSGAPGTTVDCPIQLVSVSGGVAARALQLTLDYDPSRATFEGIFDVVAPGGERRVTAAEPTVSRTGHSLLQSPDDAAAWKGTGSLVIAHFSSPATPITAATVEGGAVKGDATVAIARFKLAADVRADAPVVVNATKLVAADDGAQAVSVSVDGGLIVTGGGK